MLALTQNAFSTVLLMTASSDPAETDLARKNPHWRRICLLILIAWASTTVLLSLAPVRVLVSSPLYVSNMTENADIAYVMSDGSAYWERLYAASDLYHMGKVNRIAIEQNDLTSRYNFPKNRSETITQRAISYLESLGVPAKQISTVPLESSPTLGSWSEAQACRRALPETEAVVIVTSAPHTRRSFLCFKRAFPQERSISVHAASPLESSAELFSPIWIEYSKLALYWAIAR